jgi:hypothetical protein
VTGDAVGRTGARLVGLGVGAVGTRVGFDEGLTVGIVEVATVGTNVG